MEETCKEPLSLPILKEYLTMWMAVLMPCLGDVLAETMTNLIICKIDMFSAFMAKTISV